MFDTDASETPLRLERMIRRLRDVQAEALDRELAPFEVNATQFTILASLMSGGANCASALCRRVSYDPGAMTRMVDRLVRKGLVRRAVSLDDRRRLHLEVTDQGKAVYPELQARAERVQNRFRRGFTDGEMRQLEALLARTLANA
jgi:MarR family transcriptional regulator, multiple antibiotic resistance protein MarR